MREREVVVHQEGHKRVAPLLLSSSTKKSKILVFVNLPNNFFYPIILSFGFLCFANFLYIIKFTFRAAKLHLKSTLKSVYAYFYEANTIFCFLSCSGELISVVLVGPGRCS